MRDIKSLFDDFLVAKIDCAAILKNLEIMRLNAPAARICAAVKANAYGHGVEIAANVLDEGGVEMMAVSNFNEVEELIELGTGANIFVLGSQLSIYQGREKLEAAEWIVENDVRITPMLADDVKALDAAGRKLGKKAFVHLKLDTGMSRMGLGFEELKILSDSIIGSEFLEIEGVYTHLATADTDESSFTDLQLARLDEFVRYLDSRLVGSLYVHTANSAKALSMSVENERMIRPGLGLYGYFSGPYSIERPAIKPVMKVVSRLTVVKGIDKGSCIGYGCSYTAEDDMFIGIVPIGYGDGYDRKLSNRGKMLISGEYVSIVGRVSMDQTIVDVTGLIGKGKDVRAGSEVVIIDDDPSSENSVEGLARLLDTIPYEITTRLGTRIKRVRSDA